MFDEINSLPRDGLLQIGKKYKILGHLSDFNSPYLSDTQLRLSIIKKIEEENPIELGLKGGGKGKSKRKKTKKPRTGKRMSKKQQTLNIVIDHSKIDSKSYYELPEGAKLVAIGDIHGDLSVCIKTLKLAGVIPLSTPNYFESLKDIDNIEWIGGNTYIVQVGDQIDRCRPTSWYRDICNDKDTYQDEGSDLKIMELLDALDVKAQYQGGRIISILGNHEIMNCVGDFRYVSPKEFEEFGEYFNVKKVRSSRPRIFPYGYKERKMAFAPGGLIAKRFAYKRKSIVQVGNWLFVHGGITPITASNYTLNDMNEGIRNWLLGKRDLKTKDVFDNIYEDDDDGIFWTREFGDLGNWDEIRSCKLFNKTLDILNKKNDRTLDNAIEGMVMGHTPQYMYGEGINSSCGGKLWRVDIGASKAFGPCANCDEEHRYRKTAILVIQNGKTKIVKEK